MPRSLSLTSAQVNALTTGNDTILFNAQSRDILLYGGANLESKITILEIDNITGDCLTLRNNASLTNFVNFTLSNTGTFNVNVNGGNKKVNIVNHDGTNGLSLAGTLITSSAAQLNSVNATPGIADANKALILDENKDIVGIHNLETDNLTVNGTLVTASATELNYTDIEMAGTAQPSKVLVVDINKDISGIRNLSNEGNLDIANHNGSTTGLKLFGALVTSTASDINKLSNITDGTVAANKVIIVDNNKDLGTVRNLTSSGSVNLINHDGENVGLKLANVLVTSSADQLNMVDVTPGTAAANKAIILDENLDITGIHNLETDNLIVNGTLVTATATEINYTDVSTAGVAQPSKALIVNVDKDISGIRNLTTEGNINIYNYNGTTIGLKLAGSLVTASAPEINTLSNVVPGTVMASRALVVNSDKDLSSIRNLDIDGDFDIINHNGSTSGLKLAGELTTVSASEINTLSGVIAGTVSASKALVVDSSRDLTAVRNLTSDGSINISNYNGTTTGLKLAGTLVTASAADINKLSSVIAGTVSASKALVVDANKDLTSLGNLTSNNTITANTFTGELSTAAQPNITSVGSLTGLTTAGITLGSTAITASGTEINRLTDVNAGTVTASKALVVDINKDLSSFGNLTASGSITANTFIGTLSTVAQPNITSVGSLTGLTTAGITLGSTAITASSDEINKLTGATATTSEINTLAGVTAGTITANKALVVDGNKDLTLFRNLTSNGIITANTFAGTLSTVEQPNITSVGSLTGLTTAGITLGSTAITATGAEINTLSGVTSGTVSVSKALVVDSNKDLSSLRNLTLTGSLSGITTLGLNGVLTSSSSTTSTSTSTGSLLISGGIGISNSTDSSSNTNGGTFTSAGGGAFAKSLYVGANLTVGGNLTINGTTTSVNSTNILIEDNTIALNSGPSGTGIDSGVLTQRYQIDNSTGSGDVVNDPVKENYLLAGSSSTTITFPGAASSVTDYYKSWWIKVASGVANTHVRQISSYNGTTKIATLATPFSTIPAVNDNVNLYNKQYSAFIWQEANDRFVTAFTAIDPSTSIVSVIDYADMATNNLNILSTTTSTNNSTGALKIAGGIGISNTTDASSSTNGGTFTSAGGGAFAKALYVGTTLTATTLSGTLSTAAQANITSLGPLTGLTTSGITLGSTAITATGAEINTLAGVSAGVVSINKALVVDSNKDLSSLRNLTLTGTLSGVSTLGLSGVLTSTNSTDSSNSTTGALKLTGGIAISSTTDSSSSTNGGTFTSAGGGAFAKGLYVGAALSVGSVLDATSSTYGGSFTSSGGGAFAKALYVGTTLYCTNLSLEGTTYSSSSFNALNVTAGTAGASKALVLDSSKNIYGINSIFLNQNVNRSLLMLNSSITAGNSNSFVLGKASAVDQQAEFTFVYNTSAGTSYLALGHYGSPSSFVVLSNGNVGIGNTTPGVKLDVNGSVSIGGTVTAGSSYSCNSGNYSNAAGCFYSSKSTASGRFVGSWASSSYFGLGPNTTSSDDVVRLGICDNNGGWSGGYAHLRLGGMYASGYVGIGTASPTYPLQITLSASSTVTGYGYSANAYNYSQATRGGIAVSAHFAYDIVCSTLWAFSDRRLKYDFEPLDKDLCKDFIMKTQPLSYKFKNNNSDIRYGYIAQDVHKAGFENLIQITDQDGLEGNVEDDGFVNPENKKLVLSYEGIIPILGQNIKNIYDENTILENRIKELEEKNIILEGKNKKIEYRLYRIEQMLFHI